jgi:hypothetical protein
VIDLGEQLLTIYDRKPEECPFEAVAVAYVHSFLQKYVNMNDPQMIRKVYLFFHSMFEDYGVKYYDQDTGKFYNTSNLGEFRNQFDRQDPSRSCFFTGFSTLQCMLRSKGINHIDRENPSIKWLLEKMFGNSLQCAADEWITDECIEKIADEFVVCADQQARSGTIGNGNEFDSYREELGNDSILSAFCNKFKKELRLKEKIEFGGNTYEFCEPPLLDLLVGTYNMSTYAAFIRALTGAPLDVFFASNRSHEVTLGRRNDGKNKFTPRETDLFNWFPSIHPQSAKAAGITNVGNNIRPREDLEMMDRGMSIFLKRLVGIELTVLAKGNETTMKLLSNETDYFCRLYEERLSKRYGDDDEDLMEAVMKAVRDYRNAKSNLQATKTQVKAVEKKVKAGQKKVQKNASKLQRLETANSTFLTNIEASKNNGEQVYKKRKEKKSANRAQAMDLLSKRNS